MHPLFDIIKFMKILTWQPRHDKKLTLVELSKLTGISKTTLNEIENGNRMPNMLQMEKLAQAFDMRISDLYESEFK